jgi:DNA mismatch repair protein MutS2
MTHFYPNNIFEKLEFDKVIHLLQAECMGEEGFLYFEKPPFYQDIELLEIVLKEVREFKFSLEKNERIPVANYDSIDEDTKMLAIDGYVLALESVVNIRNIMQQIVDIGRFFTTLRKELYPMLFKKYTSFQINTDILTQINHIMDDKGVIKSSASKELSDIRSNIQSKNRELDRVFKMIVQEYRTKGFLTDNVESIRNGRRVLTAPSEHKRKIKGIIYDESASGRTAFIEPDQTIEINNDIFDLEQDEKREIYRILRKLSDDLRIHIPDIANAHACVFVFDIIQSKAKLAQKMKANLPIIKEGPIFNYRKGYHPLLYIKNKAAGKKTIPLHLNLHSDNRVVVLSGPNAGGKSIAMKSIGLLQLMFQSGLLIPVDERSEVGIFDKIFVNIGDQQSLEDDLSTYSSHLANMHYFVEHADNKSLILIDEFGTGTDPKMGGAIAESIMRDLNFKRVWAVITTHYSNLKMFAYKTDGILNACMLFDKDTLSPTYELRVGRPGSSYAFEIATKTGLKKPIIDYARKRAGENETAVDDLLIDLQREKQELEEQLISNAEKDKILDKLIKAYDQQLKDLEYRKKKHKLDTKEQLLITTAKDNKEIERLIKQLREEKNIEKAKETQQSLRQTRQQLATEVDNLMEDIYSIADDGTKTPIEVGTFVRMVSGGASGKVEYIANDAAIVQVGAMKMEIKLRDLIAVTEPLENSNKPAIKYNAISQSANFDSKLDIRGMNMVDALRMLETFMDTAMVTSSNTLNIVHGKGNGTLRKLVKKKIKEYKGISKTYHPEPHEGGDGVTIVEF